MFSFGSRARGRLSTHASGSDRRALGWRALGWFGLGLLSSAACANAAGVDRSANASARQARPAARSALSVRAHAERHGTTAARELASLLPGGGERCSVAQPALLGPAERAFAALATQSERWPWLSSLELLAYARSERASASGKRAVVELVRFAAQPRERIERELSHLLDRPIVWASSEPSNSSACDGELTCSPTLGRFLDPQTVLLTRGEWGDAASSESVCSVLVREHADALEVAARTALLSGTELRDSRSRLEHTHDGLRRITERRYAEPEAAERAQREALRGHDELATLAGLPASSLGERSGDLIAQTLFVSFADLELVLADQARANDARERARAAPLLARVDAHDAEAVCALFDAQLEPGRTAHDEASWRRLDQLLERARTLSPDHDGLARRLYQLKLSRLGDPRTALVVANGALARGLGDGAAWQLRKRAALARFDESGLRNELRTRHALAPETAARMARELASKVARGEDYERAEWAFLLAQRLELAARRVRRASSVQRVPVAELARLFAYLGQSERPQDDLGVHVLLHGGLRPEPSSGPDQAPQDGLWSAATLGGGRSGVVFAATSWDDAQLRALGRGLSLRLEEGPFELLLGLEAFASGRHATLAFAGRRQGADLWIEQVSRPLQALPWSTLERLLLEPLRGLIGAAYPPDELVLTTLAADEQNQLLRAAEGAPGVKCAVDGRLLRCHGALSDASAARRALLAISHELLAPEARLMWSGSD